MRVRAEGRVGTICLRQSCAVCGRAFNIQNGAAILVARDVDGGRIGEVCPRCAGSDAGSLRRSMTARAARLRERAEELERCSRAEIRLPAAEVHPDADGNLADAYPGNSDPRGSPRGAL